MLMGSVQPIVHRTLCCGVFLSGIHSRSDTDVLRYAANVDASTTCRY